MKKHTRYWCKSGEASAAPRLLAGSLLKCVYDRVTLKIHKGVCEIERESVYVCV